MRASGWIVEPCVWNTSGLCRSVGILAALLVILGMCAPRVKAQGCNTAPTMTVVIWFPAVDGDDSSLSTFVGGQVEPWYVHVEWNAPCLGTITITSDYGQGTQTLETLTLDSTTGIYDNGSPQSGFWPGPGFPSPPPVAQNTPWAITFTGTAGTGTSTQIGNATLLPLSGKMIFPDNKIVSSLNAVLTGGVYYNAAPSTQWFPNFSAGTSDANVSAVAGWPQSYPTNGVEIDLFTGQDIKTASSVTVTSELDSTNGIKVVDSAQLSVQPTGDPGKCDECEEEAGSPIDLATGNVWIQEKDYSLPGLSGGLQLTRTWNSKWRNLAPPFLAGMFGDSWESTFQERLSFSVPGSTTYYRADGSSWVFDSDGNLISPQNVKATLKYVPGQFDIAFSDGTQKIFSDGGALMSIVDRNGNQVTLTYDGQNRLSTVTDAASRTITFSYADPNNPNQATSVQDSVGVIANYTYDGTSRLTQVTYADGSSTNFTYGANSMIASVTDGNGRLLEAHTYDDADRGLTSVRGAGADQITADYSSDDQTQITDSLGNGTSYGLNYNGGRMRVDSISGPGCASCGGRGAQNMTLASAAVYIATDALGNLTCYSYDDAFNVTQKSIVPAGSSCSGGGGGVFAVVAPTSRPVVSGTSPIGSAPLKPSNAPSTSASCPSVAGVVRFCGVPLSVSKPAAPAAKRTKAQAQPSFDPPSDGVTWTYTYNNFSEVTTATDPAGNTTTNNYDAHGNLLSTPVPRRMESRRGRLLLSRTTAKAN